MSIFITCAIIAFFCMAFFPLPSEAGDWKDMAGVWLMIYIIILLIVGIFKGISWLFGLLF